MKPSRRWLLPSLFIAISALAQKSVPQISEAEKALDEFRQQTRTLESTRYKTGARANRPPDVQYWHGRLFENFRNNALDAVPHEVRQGGQQKSLLRRNQFGVNVSGPVPLPRALDGHKLYISLSYEGVRQIIDRANLATVPTLMERTGDFSSTVDPAGLPLPIYDPATTRLNPAYDPLQPVSTTNLQYFRDQFPGNRIPVSRLDLVARKALEDYPAPNIAIGPFFQNNYFVNTPETNDADGVVGNVETELTPRNRLIVSPSFSNGLLAAAPLFSNQANPGPVNRRYRERRARVQHVFSASANLINSFTASASRIAWDNGQQVTDNPTGGIGLSGVGSSAYPYFQLGSYLPMGQQLPDSTNRTNGFTFADSLSYHIGKHQLGVDARHSRYYVNNLSPAYPAGAFTFSPGVTSLPGIDDTGMPFASFMLGAPSLAQLTTISSPSYFLRTETAVSFHDQYQPLPNLTITFGVNLTRTTPRTEKYNRQTDVDLNTIDPITGEPGALIAAGQDGVGRALQPVRHRVEPSLGIAWNFSSDQTTVLRAGFSRSYLPIQVGQSQYNTQGYNSFVTLPSVNAQLAPALLLASGFPASTHPLPYLSGDAADNTIADYLDPTRRQPMVQSANVSLEHRFGSAMLTVGFQYGGGRDILVGNSAADPDAMPVSALQYGDALNNLTFSQALRPYPQFLNFNLNNNYPIGRYQRDAGFVRLEKRASRGIAVYVTYAYSKQWDDYSGAYGVQDFFNRQNDWSLTPGISPKTLQVDYTWELPFGHGHRMLSYSDWRDRLAQGWSISGSASVLSGTPIALQPLFNNTGGVVTSLMVDTVPGVSPRVSNPSPSLWFNPAAFAQPADFTLGTASRTDSSLRNPINQNYDLSVKKRLALDPRKTLEVGVLALNFLNHANWNNPDPVIGPASDPNLDAGKIIGSKGGRVVQLMLLVSF
jgi:hypothetical protein